MNLWLQDQVHWSLSDNERSHRQWTGGSPQGFVNPYLIKLLISECPDPVAGQACFMIDYYRKIHQHLL